MRASPSILHVDLDAFYAAVEQRDKPSLRGRPVVVGGVGPRGVVATASYEARRFGVRSAMSTAEARARCPHAAFLAPRFPAYAAASAVVQSLLAAVSPAVEPVSLDEAYVDLAAAGGEPEQPEVAQVARRLKEQVRAAVGLGVSVGAGTSKLVAKVASDMDKPDGLRIVPAGTETALLWPLPVGRLPGVGPATAARLRGAGVHTVGDLAQVPVPELVGLLGQAHGRGLAALARAEDDRPVIAVREAKSLSAEDTFAHDLTDSRRLQAELDRLVARVAGRLRTEGQSGRTVTVKVRRHDFTTLSRSQTLPAPTDDPAVVRRVARRLLGEVPVLGGIRLLGVAVSGLAGWSQAELPPGEAAEPTDPEAAEDDSRRHADPPPGAGSPAGTDEGGCRFAPGADVVHAGLGRGWVWGSGLGRVTVRFEDRTSGIGPVRTLRYDDPDLRPADPVPERPGPAAG